MKAIFEALNLREGGMIATYLTDHGVPAEVRGGNHHAVRGELYNIRGLLPQVFVLEDEDAAAAEELIKAYFELIKNAPAGDPWICPSCGEVLEPQFVSCWKCQAERPA